MRYRVAPARGDQRRVVEVSTVDQDVDLGEVLAHHFGQELRGRQAYTESFPAEMGIGRGAISQPELISADRTELFRSP
ncbi:MULTISPECIES: hypothetical protein [Streptomyces]|uniref:hypothetical protein n=1 Tax=Streptomyces TaxID=1883 RepID=UPI00240DB1A9|nr:MULTISPECIES: hypothetical protein [Streptomyces]WFB88205.1 hypothetical protein MMU79_35620 [Streptomyces olivaceus]WGK47809.1 hypothetical protein M6G09_20730 [Streptomyces sp. B146]